MKRKISYHGFVAGIIVLLSIALAHALMMLMEDVLLVHKYTGAIILGVLGMILLYIGVKKNEKKVLASMLGLLAGMLIWTGWAEFSFVWMAERLQIPDIMENGEIATRAEYLLMPSSVGIFMAIALYYLFTRSRCPLFRWLQKIFGLKAHLKQSFNKPVAVISFMGATLTLWFVYVLLMIIYDPEIAGNQHPVVWFVGIGSLIWSSYHFNKLIRINEMGYAIRYATPTIIIFWNVIEIIGRWGLLKEIWSAPQEHAMEMTIVFAVFVTLVSYVFLFRGKTKHQVT